MTPQGGEEKTMKSNFVVFRLADDEAIYLADLEVGTVERREPDEMAGMEVASGSHESHGPTVKGLDFALASNVRSPGASHVFFPNR
jgi:hypothetical protein